MWEFSILKTSAANNDHASDPDLTTSTSKVNHHKLARNSSSVCSPAASSSITKLAHENKQLKKDNNYLYKYIQELETHFSIPNAPVTPTNTTSNNVSIAHTNNMSSPVSNKNVNNNSSIRSPTNLTKIKYIDNLHETIKQLKLAVESKNQLLADKENTLFNTINSLQDIRIEALQVLPLRLKLTELKQNEILLKQKHVEDANQLTTQVLELNKRLDRKENEVSEYKDKMTQLYELQVQYKEVCANNQCKWFEKPSQSHSTSSYCC
jgi:hypothetical protein